MQVNWIDILILLVAAYFVWDGWYEGFVKQMFGLVTLLLTMLLVVKLHGLAGSFWASKFGVTPGWAEVAGYVTVGLIAELVLAQSAVLLMAKVPEKWWKSRANRILGSAASAGQALAIMTFILLVVVALPIKGTVKEDIRQSVVGGRLVVWSERYGGGVKTSLERAAAEAVKFLTIAPGTAQRVPLPLDRTGCEIRVDEAAEGRMLGLVNGERAGAGVRQLKADDEITAVARAYSRDMWNREYFSHYSPEGLSAADRMEEAGVRFTLAGENLALAPDVGTAHQGLMDSEGHRKNILEPRFGRAGIGIINAGECGMVFTQNFAD